MKTKMILRRLIVLSALAFSLTAWGQANFSGSPLPAPMPPPPRSPLSVNLPAPLASGQVNFSGSPLPTPVPPRPLQGIN
jgi:hypothetical protein